MTNTLKLLFVTSFLFLLSCKKNAEDITIPVITVVEPSSTDTISFSVEPEFHMEFTATDETNLETLNVTLFDAASNIVYSSSPSVSGLKVYPFHDHYELPTILFTSTYVAKFIATDKAGNSTTKEIHVVVIP